VVHRDIKPVNVIVTPGERVKILEALVAALDSLRVGSTDSSTTGATLTR
jgi:hypothetical protein